MPFLKYKNVKVDGFSACVPKEIVSNLDKSVLRTDDYDPDAFVKTTGVSERHFNPNAVASDMVYEAAEKLISDLKWNKNEIDALVFVTQTADYFLPATACVLQDRLGLTKNCFAMDVELGCSGWVYGMATICGLIAGGAKKVLLLCGDGRKNIKEQPDPLFGYAGTATALEYDEDAPDINFDLGTDGSGFDAIITPGGASRNQISEESFIPVEVDGQMITPLQGRMKGMDVFSFAISVAPKSVKKLAKNLDKDYLDSDWFVFHQANKMMNDIIVKKLKLPEEKVPMSLEHFGNTSSASIPLTIVTQLKDKADKGEQRFTCCGFGVGLSWGTIQFNTKDLKISDLVEI